MNPHRRHGVTSSGRRQQAQAGAQAQAGIGGVASASRHWGVAAHDEVERSFPDHPHSVLRAEVDRRSPIIPIPFSAPLEQQDKPGHSCGMKGAHHVKCL
jgi:hypothetical protein